MGLKMVKDRSKDHSPPYANVTAEWGGGRLKGRKIQSCPAFGSKYIFPSVCPDSNNIIKKKYVGEGALMVRELFQIARSKKACIVFFNEVEAIGGACFDDGAGGDNEVQREPCLKLIIPGLAGIVQAAKLLKQRDILLGLDGAVMSTQEYMKKVIEDVDEDEDFKSESWVSATDYVNPNGDTVSGCLGDIKNFMKNGKLDQVVAIVKFCSPNVIGDLTVTMKDLSGTIPGTIHHKVIGEGGYGKDITVGVALILANVSAFSPKPSMHYLNITMRNVVKVFRKDTVPGSGNGELLLRVKGEWESWREKVDVALTGRVDFGSLLAFSSFDTVLTASNSGFTGSTPSVTSFEISLTNSHSFLVSFVPFSMAASVSFVTSAVVRFLPLLQACVPLSGLCLFLIYCFPFGSFGMSLEISDAVDLPDLEPFADVVDPSMMPKFDMHLFTSTLGETHVEWITKAYDIPLDLLPRVALEGMTMDELPDDVISAPTSLKKWKYKFFFIDRRAIPIAMMWRHNDSSVVDLPPGYGEFEEGDVEKLRKVVVKLHKPYPSLLYVVGLATVWKHAGYNYLLNDPEGKVVTMAEFLRFPTFAGSKILVDCKILAGDPLHVGAVHKTVEKAAEKAAREGGAPKLAKKSAEKRSLLRRVIPILRKRKYANELLIPLYVLTNASHGSDNAFSTRLDILRNQSDGHIEENFVNADEGGGENVGKHVVNESGEENIVNEDIVHQDATNDNTDESPSIRTQPSSPAPSGRRTESLGKTVCSPDLVNKAESTFVGRFGDLPFASQWGLTESCHIEINTKIKASRNKKIEDT
ncbi:hypothetical protein Tco_0218855 [Tanacetum coccineum]